MRAWLCALLLGGCAAAQHAVDIDAADPDGADPVDSAPADAARPDAPPADAAVPDAALPDAALADAALPDAAVADAAQPDAAMVDAAVDARPPDLRLDSIAPNEGLASATLPGAVVRGAGFDATTTLSIGTNCSLVSPTELHCDIPSGSAGRTDVTVHRGDGASATLTGGFTWTAESNAVGWCDIQWPATATASANAASPYIYGQIYQSGVTDANSMPAPGITAELGYGPPGSDPRTSNDWRWVPAAPNPAFDFTGNNDEYYARVTLPGGSYGYVYRFSLDSGIHYTFCDLDTANNGFDPTQEGALTVSP